MKATQNSIRKYIVTGIENDSTINKKKTLEELRADDDLELTYSLQEDLDSILDLKPGLSKYIAISRDNPNDLGVIHRIS